MSFSGSLARRAIESAGLAPLALARQNGENLSRFTSLLESADLLVLGALADTIRRDEVGSSVRLVVGAQPKLEPGTKVVRAPDLPAHERGLAFMRAVAIARITSARGAVIAVDWAQAGFELAQVSLSFGANELCGPVLTKRGLPIAEDLTKKVKGQGMVAVSTLKKNELIDLVRRAGREPTLVDQSESAHFADETPEAHLMEEQA